MTSAYVVQSTANAPVGDEPAALHKYIEQTISEIPAEELGAITIIDKEALLEEALKGGSAENSAGAAIAAAGAEAVTPEMVAGLIQEKWAAQMATDLEAKAVKAAADAEAKANPPEPVEVPPRILRDSHQP